SKLQWTILQPSRLTDEAGTGHIALAEERGEIPRADVAAVAAEVLLRPDTAGATVPFISGTDSIAAALDTAAARAVLIDLGTPFPSSSLSGRLEHGLPVGARIQPCSSRQTVFQRTRGPVVMGGPAQRSDVAS